MPSWGRLAQVLMAQERERVLGGRRRIRSAWDWEARAWIDRQSSVGRNDWTERSLRHPATLRQKSGKSQTEVPGEARGFGGGSWRFLEVGY